MSKSAPDEPKEMTVKQFASLGGHARAASLTAQRRSEIAKYAVTQREFKRRLKRAKTKEMK